ncbi:hypothetical protein NW759_014672 [Fusarium solani]|nr:hypothetical protein NW759_014672 [Fusarium solani]
MKLSYAVFLLAALFSNADRLEAPIEGYGVVVPEWEVEVTPGGPTTVLNGTIEEVHNELLQLNPDWDEEYIGNSTADAGEINERDAGFRLLARTDFSDAAYRCGGRWPKCRTTFISQGIYYLRSVKGKPRNGPGPGNCGRVSCSFNSAIWWCNDNAKPKTLNSFGSIADGAAFIVKKCYIPDRGPPVPGKWNMISGQAFHHTNWNVIVRKDKC